MTNKQQQIFFAHGDNCGATFHSMCHTLCREILVQIGGIGRILKITLFNAPADNAEYLQNLSQFRNLVAEMFTSNTPLVAYVAQPCVTAGMAAEVTFLDEDDDVECEYRDGYILLRGDGFCELISEGVTPRSFSGGIREQSEDIFSQIGKMLYDNGFTTNDIYRQWNYIEQITSMHDGRQNYQDFNDARSRFYGSVEWEGGYPAATGIGTDCGGVMVEFYAIKGISIENHPIDNPLQTSAHSYSQKVLAGISDEPVRTTPKFERARLVGKTVYISGTAAIKGEDSLAIDNAVQQTAETMQIIKKLTSPDNLPLKCERTLYTLLRVYIKNDSESEGVVDYMEENYPDVPKHYLIADVCRSELLVEIEGTAVTM